LQLHDKLHINILTFHAHVKERSALNNYKKIKYIKNEKQQVNLKLTLILLRGEYGELLIMPAHGIWDLTQCLKS
jgi:hypothetical protein